MRQAHTLAGITCDSADARRQREVAVSAAVGGPPQEGGAEPELPLVASRLRSEVAVDASAGSISSVFGFPPRVREVSPMSWLGTRSPAPTPISTSTRRYFE